MDISVHSINQSHPILIEAKCIVSGSDWAIWGHWKYMFDLLVCKEDQKLSPSYVSSLLLRHSLHSC